MGSFWVQPEGPNPAAHNAGGMHVLPAAPANGKTIHGEVRQGGGKTGLGEDWAQEGAEMVAASAMLS